VSRRPASQIQDQLPEARVPSTVTAAAWAEATAAAAAEVVPGHGLDLDGGYRLTLLSTHASCVRLDRGSI
jgi:hypothetical protein